MTRLSIPFLLPIAVAMTAADPIAAQSVQDGWSGSVTAGVATIPRFEGADNQMAFPLLLGTLRRDNRYLQLGPTGLRINVLNSDWLALGPAASFTLGRSRRHTRPEIAALGRIADAGELGGFVEVRRSGVLQAQDLLAVSAQVAADVTGVHDGVVADVNVTYTLPLSPRFLVGIAGGIGLADDDYARRYFSVSPDRSLASGLPAFDARGGARDVSLALSGTYMLSERWGVSALVGYSRLVDDFAATPVVRIAGDRNQFSGGLGVTFRF